MEPTQHIPSDNDSGTGSDAGEVDHRRLVHVVRMGFAIVLLLVLVLSAVSLYRLKGFNTNMGVIVDVHNKKVALAFGMRDAIRQRAVSIYTMLATNDPFVRDEELMHFYSYAGLYRNRREELVSLGIDKKEKEIHLKLENASVRAQSTNRRTAELLMHNTADNVIGQSVSKGLVEQKLLLDLLDELINLQQQYTATAVQRSRNDYQFIWILQFALGIVVLVVGILIARFVTHNVRTKSFELNKKNTELARAYKISEEATKAKSTFLANMSHEIRTPMTGVLGMLDLLRETNLVSEQRYFTDTAYNSAEALLVVINDVLDLSKVEAGKVDYESILFDVRHLLEEVVGLYAKEVQGKGVEISAHIGNDVPEYVRGDPTRLRQILNNLISNAVKFTHDGEIFVSLERAESTTENGENLLRFEVVDTGIGISESAQKIIFGPFTQADESTTRKFGGTGLGLAISEQMVKLFGGELGVISEVGMGTTFWFTAILDPNERRSECREQDRFNGVSVFIFANGKGATKMIRSLVEYWGCSVIASNYDEELTLPITADVAILDVDSLVANNVTNVYALRKKIVNAKHTIGMFRLSDNDVAGKVQHFQFSASVMRPVRRAPLLTAFVGMDGNNEIIVPRPERFPPLETTERKGLSVLLVDDNAVNQQVAIAILQKQGFLVDIANDGVQALILFKANCYHVVLMDCQMPVMDGYEATQKIREYEQDNDRSPTPVIALTANTSDEDRKACFESGMDDFLVKPMRIKAVIEVFSRYLDVSNILIKKSKDTSAPVISNNTSDHFDEKLLADLEDILSSDQLTEVVTLFIEHSERRLSELYNAFQERNVEGLESVSHSLKGSSANLGAKALSEMCGHIVDYTRQGEIPADIDIRIDKIRTEFQYVKKYLKEKLLILC
ncbi:MAG: response regulator [Ectothiorhodospiraceae bacterium]|nr:response regulator [Ectothiorhodospiraceae bacterium]